MHTSQFYFQRKIERKEFFGEKETRTSFYACVLAWYQPIFIHIFPEKSYGFFEENRNTIPQADSFSCKLHFEVFVDFGFSAKYNPRKISQNGWQKVDSKDISDFLFSSK